MKHERYEGIISSPDKLEFKFFSEGPKGKIAKVIQFSKLVNSDIYHLAFGNLNKDGSIDDETTNDNKDRNKILATVVSVIYEFTSLHPDIFIIFSGSTPERTRLYRMVLSIYIEDLSLDFEIYGLLMGIDLLEKVAFNKNGNYQGFIIKRKKRLNLQL
jgi:hypothetical protein